MSYKIISLNTWGGQAFTELCQFISTHSHDTDIFCFQEIFDTNSDTIETNGARANLYSELNKLLPNHLGHRAFNEGGFDYAGAVNFHLDYGITTFVHKDILVHNQENIIIHGSPNHLNGNFGDHPRSIHLINLQKTEHQPITVINFHGLWKAGFGKGDCPERLSQSMKIQQIVQKQTDPVILIGDFNLLPKTQSLAILKENLRDLISEFQITDTRSELYKKPERYADYALISPEINVESFELPQVNASDHLPLILKIK